MKLKTLYSRATNGKINEFTIEVEKNKYRTITGYIDGVKTTSSWTECKAKTYCTAEEQALKEAKAIHRKKKEAGAFENIKDIDWIDITNNSDAEKETSRNDRELLRRLHVKENGKIIQGAEAFLYVWKKIPKYKFLYKFFKLPIIFTIFKYGYEMIAFFLYLKNKKQLKN